MNERIVAKGNVFAVGAYKVVGFALLLAILLGLISYLATQGFFVVSRSWITPTIVSPTDDRILSLSARLAELSASRARLAAERRELDAKLRDAARQAEAGEAFQRRFLTALAGDRKLRAKAVSRLAKLRDAHQAADQEISESNQAYSGLSRTRSEALKGAAMLTRENYLTTNYQLAQIAGTNLQLAEKSAALETTLAALRREAASLTEEKARALTDPTAVVDVSAAALLIQQRFVDAKLAQTKQDDDRDVLSRNIASIDEVLGNYDAMLASIKNSPYMRALEGNITVAFVPYDNVDEARPGTRIYACSVGFLWCRDVGRIAEPFQGEVSMRHPVRHENLRGEMVEIRLNDPRWVQKDLLHMGRPPLFF